MTRGTITEGLLAAAADGSGGTSAGQASTSRFEALAAREGFLVATLQADQNRRWNVPPTDGRADDVLYVSDVIDHVSTRACTDGSRVYATGFSGGGLGGAQRLRDASAVRG